MALNKTLLATGIFNAFNANISGATAQQTQQMQTLSNSIADAIDVYVKSGAPNYIAGLVAPSGGGPVTGTLATATIT